MGEDEVILPGPSTWLEGGLGGMGLPAWLPTRFPLLFINLGRDSVNIVVDNIMSFPRWQHK